MCAFSDSDFQVYKQRSNVRERFKCIDLWVNLTSEGVMLIRIINLNWLLTLSLYIFGFKFKLWLPPWTPYPWVNTNLGSDLKLGFQLKFSDQIYFKFNFNFQLKIWLYLTSPIRLWVRINGLPLDPWTPVNYTCG